MKNILGVTNELSLLLQRKDQDIINAVTQVKVFMQRLQMMRNDECESLLTEVSSFCINQGISISNMNDKFVTHGRSRHKSPKITN